jgi:hypothetical protein
MRKAKQLAHNPSAEAWRRRLRHRTRVLLEQNAAREPEHVDGAQVAVGVEVGVVAINTEAPTTAPCTPPCPSAARLLLPFWRCALPSTDSALAAAAAAAVGRGGCWCCCCGS